MQDSLLICACYKHMQTQLLHLHCACHTPLQRKMPTDTHCTSSPVSCSWAHPSSSMAQWKPHSRGFWKHAPLRFFAFLTGFCLPRSFLFLQGSILNHIFPYPNGNLVSYLFLIFLYTNSSWTGLSLPMGSWTPSGWERAASGLRVTMAPWFWDAVPAPSPARQLSQPLFLILPLATLIG